MREKCAMMDEILDHPESDAAKAYREFRQGNQDARIFTRETLSFADACAAWGEMRAVAAIWDELHPDRRSEISSKRWTLRPELDKSEIDAFCAALQALKA